MKNLVLYSDQIYPLSEKIDKELLTLLPKKHPHIGYIPSMSDPQRKYYKERQSYYNRIGVDLRIYFELDKEFQTDILDSLLSCDAIHLSGGDTYYFLYWLRKREMLEPLRRYVKHGGVLIGVSAGSILMTPNISISPYVNEPIEVETDFTSLNLVDFAFAPHYKSDKISADISALRRYSHEHQMVVYACQDSGGIVVTDDKVRCIGDILKIDKR